MTAKYVQSISVADLDDNPAVRSEAGQGGAGILQCVNDYVVVTDSDAIGSIYSAVRVPSNAVVKSVQACLDAAGTTITGDIGVYYSDNATDGTKAANATNPPTVVSVSLFAATLALAAVIEPTEYSGQSGTFTGAARNQPLWQAAGLSSDPGGYFDVALTLTSEAGSTSNVSIIVRFV